MLRGRVWGEERQGEWIPLVLAAFFFFFLWLVSLFYLIHSRGFGGKGFTTSSSFSWDWREVFFFSFGAMREGRIPKTREASHDFILISISFFSISRRRIGWVATCGISHPLKSIYLFYEARQTHKFWVVGQQCVFSLPAIKKKIFSKADIFFFFVWYPVQGGEILPTSRRKWKQDFGKLVVRNTFSPPHFPSFFS